MGEGGPGRPDGFVKKSPKAVVFKMWPMPLHISPFNTQTMRIKSFYTQQQSMFP
jgi:hypothetical protein